MFNLLHHFYTSHINSSDPHSKEFCNLRPIQIFNLTQDELAFYRTMHIRNFFTYSAASLQIKLSPKHLLGLSRLHKVQQIMKSSGLNSLFMKWIESQMMPFVIENSKQVGSTPYAYIDDNPEQIQNKEQQEQRGKKVKTKIIEKGHKKKQQKYDNKKESRKLVIANLNILEITRELQNRVLIKQLNLKAQDVKNNDKRQEYIQRYCKIKIEQYINQRFNSQTLLTFNFIKANPYIDQKQLLKKTMLSSVELRKSLAHLISEGIVNFYPENVRTLLYKSLSNEKMKERYEDHVAQAILNLHIFLEKAKQEKVSEQKMQVILRSIQNLDDILMIFMS